MFLKPNRLYQYMDTINPFYNFIYATLNKALLFLPELIAMCLAIN